MKKVFTILAAALLAFSCTSSLEELHETVTLDGDHGKIIGQVDRPAIDAAKAPVMIFYHGLTGFRTEQHINAICDSVYNAGVAVVRFDFNGHGESEGLFSAMTLDNEVNEAKIIYEYVASLPWVDTENICIAGHSQGGLVTGVTAGDLGASKVRCAVLLAPAACIHTMASSGHMFGYEATIDDMPDSIVFWKGLYLGKPYMISARDMDVYGRTSNYEGPMSVIQGTNDGAELARDAARYPEFVKNCEFHPLEGLTHCFPEDYATPAILTRDFILEHLK